MKLIYWLVPILVVLCLAGCSGIKMDYEGKWVNTYSDITMEITGNKLVLEFGELRESYKFKVKKEGGSISLSNTNGDGSFDLMTELNRQWSDCKRFKSKRQHNKSAACSNLTEIL